MSRFKQSAVVVFLVIPLAWVGADTYTEDFAQADGPPEGWVVVTPTVLVESEQLTLTPGGAGEVDVYAGQDGVGLYFESITHIEFDMSYPGVTGAWPFDHGGVIFCGQNTTGRYGTTCYVVDYLAMDGATSEAPGRFRLGRFINGTEQNIATTAQDIQTYEGKWAIDMTETTITFSFDGAEVFTEENTEIGRSGYVGFWAYQSPAENKVAVDNLSIDHTPGPCPMFVSDSVVMTEGKANAFLPVRIPIDANETEAYEVTVTSDDPGTAAVLTSPLTFAVGDPLVDNAEIQPGSAGQTLLNLSVAGEDCSGMTALAEVLAAVAYEETFTQDDGPPEGWYIASDTAQVINNELSLSAPGQPFVWYAIEGEPLNVPKIDAVRAKIKFAQAALPVGAHGGIYLAPAYGSARDKGYMIDVIERASDNGFRIYKDNNATVQLGGPRQPYIWDDQWHDWELEFTPTGFTFKVDGGDDPGEANVNVEDLTYRGGYLSFWCYTGAAGQNLFVDDIRIEFGSSACPSISPLAADNRPVNPKTVFTVTRPFGVNDVEDYNLTVTSTDPAVAVPVGAVGGSLVLTWPVGDASIRKTFEAACLSPGTTEFVLDTGETSCIVDTAATFTVNEPGLPGFCDDFAQADGPPENWTVHLGNWQVAGEELVVECAAGENPRNETWIWATNPAQRLEGTASMSFSAVLTQTTPDAVGRHGGIMFFAAEPTHRYVASGYEVDWIDRAEDRGYRFLRSDNGTHTVIAGPTLAAFDLGTNWRLEVDGDNLKLYVDEVEIFNVVDPTYREGYFGLWTYCNTTRMVVDDVVLGECPPPACTALNPVCTVTETEELQIALTPDPEGCVCETVDIAIDDVPVASVDLPGDGIITLALPDPCDPATEHTVTVTCGPDGTPETCTFTCPGPPPCTALNPACTVNDDYMVEVTLTPDPEGCACETVDISIDGEPVDSVDLPVDGIITLVPPDPCVPGTEHTLTVVCSPDGAPETCTFTCPPPRFVRGDANADGTVDVGDAVYILQYLFTSGPLPTCMDTADTNDSGIVDIADGANVLYTLFGAGVIPPPDVCGEDPTEDPLGCDWYEPCMGPMPAP